MPDTGNTAQTRVVANQLFDVWEERRVQDNAPLYGNALRDLLLTHQ